MAPNRVRQPLGEDVLAATVRAAKEAPNSQLNTYRDAFPGQVGQLTFIPAVNSPRWPTASGTAALLTDWS